MTPFWSIFIIVLVIVSLEGVEPSQRANLRLSFLGTIDRTRREGIGSLFVRHHG